MNTQISTYCTSINVNTLFIKRTYILNLFYKSNNYLLFFFYNNLWFFLSPLNIFNNSITNIFLHNLYFTKTKGVFFSKQLKTYNTRHFLYYKNFKHIAFFYKKLLQYPFFKKSLNKRNKKNNEYITHPSFISFYGKLYTDNKLRILTPMLKAEQFNFLPLPATPFKTVFKSTTFAQVNNNYKRFKFLDLISNLTKKIKITSIKDKSLFNLTKFAKLIYKTSQNKVLYLLPRQHIFLNSKSRLNVLDSQSSRDYLLSHIYSIYKKGLNQTEINTLYPITMQENINDAGNDYLSYTRAIINTPVLFERRIKDRSKLEWSFLSNPLDITRLFHYKIDIKNRLLVKSKFENSFNNKINLQISKIIKQLDSSHQIEKFKKFKKKHIYLNTDYFTIYNTLLKRSSIPIYTALNISVFTKLTVLKYYNIFRYWSLSARRLYTSQMLHTSNKQKRISKKWISNLMRLEYKDLDLQELNIKRITTPNKMSDDLIFNNSTPTLKSLFRIRKKCKISTQIGIHKWVSRYYSIYLRRLGFILNSTRPLNPSNSFVPFVFTIWDNFKRLKNFSKLPESVLKLINFKKPIKKKLTFNINARSFFTIIFSRTHIEFEKVKLLTDTDPLLLIKKKNLKKKNLTKSFFNWESELWNPCVYHIHLKNYTKMKAKNKTKIKLKYSIQNFENMLVYDFGLKVSNFFLLRIIKNLIFKNIHKPLLLMKIWSSLNQVSSIITPKDFTLLPLNCDNSETTSLNYSYLQDLNFFKKIILNTLLNKYSVTYTCKYSKHISDSHDYHLFSKYSRAFISLSTGFLFTNCNFLYHKKFQLDSLKVSHMNRQRYSFFYKNDIKRFYLNRSGNLTFLQNLDTNTFLRNKSIYDRLYLRKNHYTHDSIGSLYSHTIANTSIDSFFTKHNAQKKLVNTYGFYDPSFTHKSLIPRLWEPRIKRIRFKPGYQRIWRKAREGINFSLKFNLRYQHRLTHKLSKLRFIKHKCTTRVYDLTLIKILVNTRFVYDLNSSKSLINNALVYVNGIVSLNPNLLLYVGDFIQIAISIKYYIIYRWLVNWNFNQRARLTKLSFYKNKVKHDLAKQKSNILPDWIFKIGSRQIDIPKYTEVDYFTLSIFIIYEPLSVNEFNPLLFLEDRSYILNMYNWKFIN